MAAGSRFESAINNSRWPSQSPRAPRDAASSGTLARVLRQMHSLDKGAANEPRARAF